MPRNASLAVVFKSAVRHARIVALAILVGAATPASPQTATELFASLVAEVPCPLPAEIAQPFPGRPSCSDAAQPDWLRSVETNRYYGRSGSLVLAAQIAGCNGRNLSALLAAYEATQPDVGSLAVVELAAGVVTTDEYDGLVSEWLSRLAAVGSKQLDPLTGISFLQFAAGRCLNALTDECLSRMASHLPPADWSLTPDAALAIGDLFGRPLALTDKAMAVTMLRHVVDLGLPLRLDILTDTQDVRARQVCKEARRVILSSLLGFYKEP